MRVNSSGFLYNEGERMKKILFVIHDLMGGGAEKVLVNMVNNMDAQKYDITVLALFDEGVHRDSLKFDIHYKYFFKKCFKGNKYFFRLFTPEFWYKKAVGDEKFDIVVSYLEGTCARIVSGCNTQGTKKVAWIHRERDEKDYCVCFKSKKEADALYGRFDRIVCVAQSLKENFCSFNGLYDKTEVLYNVNETDKIIKLASEEADGNIFDGVPTVAFLGKVIKNKGIFRLAEIHVKLCRENIPHRFLIIGEGPDKEPVKNYLEENHSTENFVFTGFQKNPYKYLARCDLFVCASFAEGFSTAATEALVLGVPCVVTDCSGMKEMMGSGNEYGIVTENSTDALYDALRDMLTTPGKLYDYKNRAIKRGADFTMEKTLSKLEEFFDNI